MKNALYSLAAATILFASCKDATSSTVPSTLWKVAGHKSVYQAPDSTSIVFYPGFHFMKSKDVVCLPKCPSQPADHGALEVSYDFARQQKQTTIFVASSKTMLGPSITRSETKSFAQLTADEKTEFDQADQIYQGSLRYHW